MIGGGLEVHELQSSRSINEQQQALQKRMFRVVS